MPSNGRILKYPAVLQEVADNIQKYPGCVILTKVGGFYELYFDQARELGALLNLKVAERKYAGGRVPMVSGQFANWSHKADIINSLDFHFSNWTDI